MNKKYFCIEQLWSKVSAKIEDVLPVLKKELEMLISQKRIYKRNYGNVFDCAK